jgi:hypothetical protein
VRDKLFKHSEVIAEEVSSSYRLRNTGAGWMRREIYYIEVISLAVEAYLPAVFHLAVPGFISC